jgi:hypothetical protein
VSTPPRRITAHESETFVILGEDHWLRAAPGKISRVVIALWAYSALIGAFALGASRLAAGLTRVALPETVARVTVFVVAIIAGVISADYVLGYVKKKVGW